MASLKDTSVKGDVAPVLRLMKGDGSYLSADTYVHTDDAMTVVNLAAPAVYADFDGWPPPRH